MTLDHDDSTVRFCTFPRARRLAAACTILSSVIAASPMPLLSASRAGGAATTSAKEPNLAISSLASGLMSRCGMAQHQLQELIVADRVGPGFAKPRPQPFAVAVIMRRTFRKAGWLLDILLVRHDIATGATTTLTVRL